MLDKNIKVALVTDWLTNLGGGEKVVEAISELFPNAPIFTTVCNNKKIGKLSKRNIHTSFLQKIPFLNKRHQFLLPLLPLAVESLDLSEYDLVLSFSASVAKSVLTNPEQTHICYIHSPMRYAWEPFFDRRFDDLPSIFQGPIKVLLHKLRLWDYSSALRPDFFIANSSTTSKRVKKYYNRDSDILYPPVESQNFKISDTKKDYFLGVGRMVSYKKFDLLVKTFLEMQDKELVLIGGGPELKKLKQMAKEASNIRFIEKCSRDELSKYYSEAKAFLLPQKEDAGIVQLEAMAAGTPVIAFKQGGALDVIKDRDNGVFFEVQTVEYLKKAILEFEKMSFSSQKIRDSILKHDKEEFKKNYLSKISEIIHKKKT